MSLRPVPPDPVATPRVGSNHPASKDRLRAVLQSGMALAPKTDGVSTDVKRQRDGSFVLSPEELQTIVDTDDVDDLPIALRQAYKTIPRPVPKVVGRTRYGHKIYLLPTERLKRVYLRYSAVRTFATNSLEQFYDEAAQGVYGDVEEGDWEAAGITPEDSVAVKLSKELLDPLEEQWGLIENYWKSKGIDVEKGKYVIEEGENVPEYAERFDEKYEEHIQEYLSSGGDMGERAFEQVLNDFVDSMIAN